MGARVGASVYNASNNHSCILVKKTLSFANAGHDNDLTGERVGTRDCEKV